MIRSLLSIALLIAIHTIAIAQDEGAITKRSRVISKSTSLHFAIGPSLSFGTGDYSSGLNVHLGLRKKLNRIVSIGPWFSLAKFNYDNKKGNKDFIETGGYEIRRVALSGGDLTLSSLGLDMKFNFVPSERIKKFSAYAITQPFVLMSKRSALSGQVETWYRDDATDNRGTTWYYSGTTEQLSPQSWDAKSEFSAGLNLGLGGEMMVSSSVSLFLQTSALFTLPVTHINSDSFSTSLNGYNSPEFPFAKKSFPFVNVSAGVSITF